MGGVRKLMWFTVGAVTGLGIGIWLISGHMLWILGIVAGIVGIVLSLLPLSVKIGKIPGMILIGCCVGLVWMFFHDQTHMQPARELDNSILPLKITVTDYGTVNDNGSAAEGVFSRNGYEYKVKFYIDEQVALAPGDRVSSQFYMRYTGYDGHLLPTFHQGEGIMLLAYADEPAVIQCNEQDLGFTAQNLRHQIKALIYEIFPEDTAGFATALLLGDSTGLNAKDETALQNSGIRHVIAVSGLHISILFAFIQLLLGKRKWLCALIGLPLLFLFAFVAGFTPSVTRACIMQTVMILGTLFKKEYDSLTALSVAVLVILGINPLALTGVSFQLSICSVLGIVLFSGDLQKRIMEHKWLRGHHPDTLAGKLIHWFAGSVAVSVNAMFLTLPFCSHYFGIVSTMSILTNLLTLWLITYIFCGLIICCVAGFVYAPVGAFLASVVALPMRLVLWVARVISTFPYAAISTKHIYIVAWLLLVYVLIGLQYLLRSRRGLLILGCIAVSLCGALSLTALENANNHFTATVLDVGQGQCVIFQSGDGCYVVDCGGDSPGATADLSASYLHTQGIHHVDGLILTHFDRDHGGGAHMFMAQMETDALYLPDCDPEEPLRLELVQEHADKIQWVRNDRYFAFGDAILSIFPASMDAQGNESSMCILFQAKDCDILITGDKGTLAEQALLEQVRLPQIDILIAGHHGAYNSSSVYLLQAIKPKTVVISVGEGNYYGHPAPILLERLRIFGCEILRTDQQGTIVFKG